MANTRELSQFASLIHVIDENKSIGIVTSYPNANIGVGTLVPTSKVDVVGDVNISGVVTATSFFGDGSNLTGLSVDNSGYFTGIITATTATFTGTGAVGLNTGTTAQRPASPDAGMIRYNSEIEQFEGYTNSWGSLGGDSGASGSGGDAVFYENDITVTTSYTITSGKNAMSAGPITINAGATVTIPAGSVWTIV